MFFATNILTVKVCIEKEFSEIWIRAEDTDFSKGKHYQSPIDYIRSNLGVRVGLSVLVNLPNITKCYKFIDANVSFLNHYLNIKNIEYFLGRFYTCHLWWSRFRTEESLGFCTEKNKRDAERTFETVSTKWGERESLWLEGQFLVIAANTFML